MVAEVDLEMLCGLHVKVDHVRSLPRFPAVTRDIALVMDEKTTVGAVLSAIRAAGGALLENCLLYTSQGARHVRHRQQKVQRVRIRRRA